MKIQTRGNRSKSFWFVKTKCLARGPIVIKKSSQGIRYGKGRMWGRLTPEDLQSKTNINDMLKGFVSLGNFTNNNGIILLKFIFKA